MQAGGRNKERNRLQRASISLTILGQLGDTADGIFEGAFPVAYQWT